MNTTLQELNKEFHTYLNGNKLIWDDPKKKIDLTDDEVYFIGFWIKKKYFRPNETSVVAPISRRFHLDFLGYQNPDHDTILICRNRIKSKFYEKE